MVCVFARPDKTVRRYIVELFQLVMKIRGNQKAHRRSSRMEEATVRSATLAFSRQFRQTAASAQPARRPRPLRIARSGRFRPFDRLARPVTLKKTPYALARRAWSPEHGQEDLRPRRIEYRTDRHP